MDIQFLLIFILIVLTINVLIVGAYVVLILKDVRNTLKRLNKVIDGFDSVGSILSNPVNVLTSIAGTLQEGVRAVHSIKSLKKNED